MRGRSVPSKVFGQSQERPDGAGVLARQPSPIASQGQVDTGKRSRQQRKIIRKIGERKLMDILYKQVLAAESLSVHVRLGR